MIPIPIINSAIPKKIDTNTAPAKGATLLVVKYNNRPVAIC
jgi:hypothetical protein